MFCVQSLRTCQCFRKRVHCVSSAVQNHTSLLAPRLVPTKPLHYSDVGHAEVLPSVCFHSSLNKTTRCTHDGVDMMSHASAERAEDLQSLHQIKVWSSQRVDLTWRVCRTTRRKWSYINWREDIWHFLFLCCRLRIRTCKHGYEELSTMFRHRPAQHKPFGLYRKFFPL